MHMQIIFSRRKLLVCSQHEQKKFAKENLRALVNYEQAQLCGEKWSRCIEMDRSFINTDLDLNQAIKLIN